MNALGLLKTSKIKFAGLIIILSCFSQISQIVSINSNTTKIDNKYIIDLEYNENQIYSANLWIGSNHQKINVVFSTISELSMLTSQECLNCTNVKNIANAYENKKSESFKNLTDTIKIFVK
jgi:hypothetical protein